MAECGVAGSHDGSYCSVGLLWEWGVGGLCTVCSLVGCGFLRIRVWWFWFIICL